MSAIPVQIENRLPAFIGLNTTHICNFQCTYCPYHSRVLTSNKPNVKARKFTLSKEVFFDQIRTLIDFYKKNDASFSLNFSGLGEPFLNRDLIPMMEFSHAHGIRFSVVSNFSQPISQHIEHCVDMGINAFNTNLDGGSKKEYEATRPGSNFETTLANLEKASNYISKRDASTKINLHFIITPQNVHTLEKVIQIAYDLGIKNFIAKMVVEMEYSTDGLFFKNFESHNELFEIIKSAERVATSLGINFSLPLYSAILADLHREPLEDIYNKPVPCWTAFDCMWLNFGQMHFTEEELIGNMSLVCPMRKSSKYMFGNLRRNNLSDIINNRYRLTLMKALHEKKFPATCRQCEYNYLHIYKIISKRLDNCEAACQSGEQNLFSGNLEKALINFTRAMEEDHCSPDANHGIARTLAAMGQYGKALSHIKKAVEFRPNNISFIKTQREIQGLLEGEEI